jgi:hypothetical protein
MFKLEFDAKTHSYLNPYTKETYISATQLLSKFKKPFNVEIISKRVAEKEGVSQDEIKEKWKKINEDSKVYGSKIHSVLEDYNSSKIITDGYADLIDAYKKLRVIADDDTLLVEEKLHNHHYKLAGTADIIRLEDKGGFSVFDLKTNKKFNLFNQYSEYLLSPVSHLTSCEYTTYALQLSLYAFMYQNMTGRNVNQLGIIYYNREDKEFLYYPVTYMKADALIMLDYYAKNLVG